MCGRVEHGSSNVQFDDGGIAARGRKLALFHCALSLARGIMLLFLAWSVFLKRMDPKLYPYAVM